MFETYLPPAYVVRWEVIFSHVCVCSGREVPQFQILSQVSGPRSFPGGTPSSGPMSFLGVPHSLVPCPFWGYPILWSHVLSGSKYPSLWSHILSEGYPSPSQGVPQSHLGWIPQSQLGGTPGLAWPGGTPTRTELGYAP